MHITTSLIALGLNADNEPACLMLLPESLPENALDLTKIESATLTDLSLDLHLTDQTVSIMDLTDACRGAALRGLPLIVLDPGKEYECLIEIKQG